MNRPTKLIGILLAGIALAGCPRVAPPTPEPAPEPKPKTYPLTVRVTERGGALAIEKTHVEELVELHDGDSLEWKCEWVSGEPCSEEIFFTVRDIHHVVQLSAVGLDGEVELGEWVPEFLDRFESAAESEPAAGESAVLSAAMEKITAPLPAAALVAPGKGAFAREVTELTSRGAGIITSPAYGSFDHDHLWKFEWVVTRGEEMDNWDPHFRGHKTRR